MLKMVVLRLKIRIAKTIGDGPSLFGSGYISL
jgi:hypothetical protein